ncbi:hypothetical protein DICA1_C09538 [Diutina catenulata]
MDVLVSTPARGGGMCVVEVSRGAWGPPVAAGHPHVTQVLTGRTANHKHWLAVVRASGLIQLYERSAEQYSLFKEWKNSVVTPDDPVVAAGFAGHRYLYSCSADGKLVVRDLINDDANESCRVYYVAAPVSCVWVDRCGSALTVSVAGKKNHVSVYRVPPPGHSRRGSDTAAPAVRGVRGQPRLVEMAVVREWPDALDSHPWVHSSDDEDDSGRRFRAVTGPRSRCLVPQWSAEAALADYVYTAIPAESVCSWVVSMCRVGAQMVCGTQFGEVVVYCTRGAQCSPKPTHRAKVSQFGLQLAKPTAGDHVFFCDGIAQMGVIDVARMAVVQRFSFAGVGPVHSWSVVASESTSPAASCWYAVVTAMDHSLAVFKLRPSSTQAVMVSRVSCPSAAPSACVLGTHRDMERVFGDGTSPPAVESYEVCASGASTPDTAPWVEAVSPKRRHRSVPGCTKKTKLDKIKLTNV